MGQRFELSGKVAIVTGAARGIGYATATELARRGSIVIVVDLDPDAASAAAAGLPGTAIGLAADVTDRGAMQRVVAEAVERFGGVDVVVANAGIASRGATFRAMSGETFDRVLDVNLNGVHRTVTAALPEIVRRRGHVVVVSSVYAFINGVGATPYAMSKAGVEQLGRALRVELAQHGAGASVAYFGFIDTAMVHQALDDDPLGSRLKEAQPAWLMKRLQPAAAGKAIVAGIERRAPRIIRPRRWAAFSVLRGIVNPLLDRSMARQAEIQDIARELDKRGDEEQTTTA
ncbi:MAG TPA: short-chain dehydrogenase/reductase [Solirubrobacterales bacterium]|jgi:NAD(P)-dependent dehydrogenase (short-subunit alcohol dehydrogenase family)|nr:short-chain dehydrogenase/reductase [Solirubrobacterales bacterium]